VSGRRQRWRIRDGDDVIPHATFTADERALPDLLVVVQFGKGASQTRGYCGAQNAPQRAARPDPSPTQKTLARDDNQTAPLPIFFTILVSSSLPLGRLTNIFSPSKRTRSGSSTVNSPGW